VLLGTRVDAASGRGSAILATPDGQQKSVGVGEEIMPGVRLAAVEFESVTLDRGGAREQLYIDQSGSAADAAPPRQDKK
jgi:general secretion pathway protein C